MADKEGGEVDSVTGTAVALVTRSPVPAGLPYTRYRPYLRKDFFFSCGYCTITEAEAQAIRFTIDHYEPVNSRPDLENDYVNLMYACDECNQRKGDRVPSAVARQNGVRFFKPDEDAYADHFEKDDSTDSTIEPKTGVASYTIDALDLNRLTLRRLREIRARLITCDRYVFEGIAGLRAFRIDQLPPQVKAQAASRIKDAINMANSMVTGIDEMLASFAKSPLSDPDDDLHPSPEELARLAARAGRLKDIQALYPGSWRAPRKSRKKI